MILVIPKATGPHEVGLSLQERRFGLSALQHRRRLPDEQVENIQMPE